MSTYCWQQESAILHNNTELFMDYVIACM